MQPAISFRVGWMDFIGSLVQLVRAACGRLSGEWSGEQRTGRVVFVSVLIEISNYLDPTFAEVMSSQLMILDQINRDIAKRNDACSLHSEVCCCLQRWRHASIFEAAIIVL